MLHGCVFFHYFFANSMTNWAQIFTGLLFYAHVGIRQVRILVFDNYQRCPVSLLFVLLIHQCMPLNNPWHTPYYFVFYVFCYFQEWWYSRQEFQKRTYRTVYRNYWYIAMLQVSIIVIITFFYYSTLYNRRASHISSNTITPGHWAI